MYLLGIVERVEKIILQALICLMGLVVLLSTLELTYILIQNLMTPPLLMLNIDKLLDLFGYFFMILIGIELLETIKSYFKSDRLHVEVVITVSIIAIARKVIILDLKELPPLTLVGIGVIIIALSAGYYLLKQASDEQSNLPAK